MKALHSHLSINSITVVSWEPLDNFSLRLSSIDWSMSYNAKCRWEPVHLYKACWIEADDEKELENFKKRKYQYMAKDIEGRDVFLADSGYVLSMAQQDFENIRFHFTSEF